MIDGCGIYGSSATARRMDSGMEELRSLASQIKEHTLSHLADYLEEFEARAIENGAHVHWARDATEHNQIVYDILVLASRQNSGQEQVDAHRGMRHAPVPRTARH